MGFCMIPLYTNDQVPWNLVVVFFALSAATAPLDMLLFVNP